MHQVTGEFHHPRLDHLFYSMVAGCPGCVWGAANAMPELAVKLYDLVSTGKLVEARAVWEKMSPSYHKEPTCCY